MGLKVVAICGTGSFTSRKTRPLAESISLGRLGQLLSPQRAFSDQTLRERRSPALLVSAACEDHRQKLRDRHANLRAVPSRLTLGLRCVMASIPITLVLDNARYQWCRLVQDLAKSLNIELLFLPFYSPNQLVVRHTVICG